VQLIRAGQSVELEVEGLEPLVEVLAPVDPNLPPPPPSPPKPPAEPPRIRAVVTKAIAGEYVLSLASGDERPRGMQAGARVVVRYITTLGLHHGKSVVVQIDQGGGDAGIQLTMSELTDVETIQRRKHYRVGAVLPVDLAVLETSLKDLEDAEDRATTLNFSGGGFLIETKLQLALGDRVRLTLRVPKDLRQDLPALLVCQAIVVRVEVVTFDQFRLALQSSFPRDLGRDLWVQLTLNLQFGRG
jgi:hypothetical protein